MKLWHFISGYVMIQVEGLSLERFVDEAGRRGVKLFGARRVSYTALSAGVTARGFGNLLAWAPERYNITAGKGFGLPFLLRRLVKRKAILIGLAAFILALIAATQFVWGVEVEGVSFYEGEKIRAELGSMGLKPWAYKGSPNLRKIIIDMLVAHDEIAWMDIHYSGVIAVVKIVPAIMPPAVYDEKRPCNIIAKKDAFVESVIQLAGRAVVKEGDTVRAGDILISGVVADEGKPVMLFAAKGKVIGAVWYKGEAQAPVYEQTRVKTGRTQAERVVVIGADTASLDGPCRFADYDTAVTNEYALGGELFLPVKVRLLLHSEVRVTLTPVPFGKLRAGLEEKAYYEALGKAPEGAEIAGHRTIYSLENDMMKASVYLETREDIGRAVYLEE